MEKHFDLKVEDCREQLFNVLNNSGLPMSVISMVVNDLQSTVNSQYMRNLESLRAQERQIENNEDVTV